MYAAMLLIGIAAGFAAGVVFHAKFVSVLKEAHDRITGAEERFSVEIARVREAAQKDIAAALDKGRKAL